MKKITLAALVLAVCVAPAFAWPWHKKPHKDPRVVDHPKAMHQKNLHRKEIQKHKMPKHNTGH
jgi:hypothetical protein